MLRSMCVPLKFQQLNQINQSFLKHVRCKHSTISMLSKSKSRQETTNEYIKWMLMVIPAGSFGLGCWQTYRLKWKLDLIKEMQEKSNAPPVDLPLDFTELVNMEYRQVKVRGRFIHDKEFFIGPRALIENESPHARRGMASDPKKNQGWLVVSPFQLSDTGEVILVNRGWIPQSYKPKTKREPSFINNEVELTGIVRLTEKRQPFMLKNLPEKKSWFYRDLDAMSEHMDCSPVWIDARGISDPPEGWPIPNQTRVTLRNEHMSYLITWYSLSALTAFMWHRIFIRKLPLV